MTNHELLYFCKEKVSSAGWIHTLDHDRLGFDVHHFVIPKLNDCYCELILFMGEDYFRMITYTKVTDGLYTSKHNECVDYCDTRIVYGELLVCNN